MMETPPHPLHIQTQKALNSLIPEGGADQVIEGVCAWLADMGILDGDDDEVLERIFSKADEGRLR